MFVFEHCNILNFLTHGMGFEAEDPNNLCPVNVKEK